MDTAKVQATRESKDVESLNNSALLVVGVHNLHIFAKF